MTRHATAGTDRLSLTRRLVAGFFVSVLIAPAAFAADTDADGMDDAYETFFGLQVGTNDSAANLDGDNWSNLAESAAWTDPQAADTDWDGWMDHADATPVSRAVLDWRRALFTDGDAYAYTAPAWWLGATKSAGTWETNGWRVLSSETNEAVVRIDLDRATLSTNLVLALSFADIAGGVLTIDLVDTNDLLVATNLFGNLVTGTGSNRILGVEVPLETHGDAATILLRRGAGETLVAFAVLYIDADGDGLDAEQEAQLGASDNAVDSDGDGYGDFAEAFIHATNPADAWSLPPAQASVFAIAGTITTGQASSVKWHSYVFPEPLYDPVVVMGPLSFGGAAPTLTRVRNVTTNGFEWQMDEWDYLDGGHSTETVGFIAVSRGAWELADGTRIQAHSASVSSTNITITMPRPMDAAPVLLAQIASTNDPRAACVRLSVVTESAFDARLQSEEAVTNYAHGAETLNWIAWARGNGTVGSGKYDAEVTGNVVSHIWRTVTFTTPFSSTPVLLANTRTLAGIDPIGLRYRLLNVSGVELKADEEQSKDAETNHAAEAVGYLAMTPGVWSAVPRAAVFPVSLVAQPSSGFSPLTVLVSASASNSLNERMAFNLNMGDGAYIAASDVTSTNFQHVYSGQSTNIIQLTVTTPLGDSVARSQPVTVWPALRLPENPTGTVAGLDYAYYEGYWNVLPNFAALTPVRTGQVSELTLDPRRRDEGYAMTFTGYLNIETNAYYTFTLKSSEGARFYVGDTLVADNDGVHGVTQTNGPISLATGKHAIRLEYFEYVSAETVTLTYARSGLPAETVPLQAFYREGAPSASVSLGDTVPGLDYQSHLVYRDTLAGVNDMPALGRGAWTNLAATVEPWGTNFYALQFSGFLSVTQAGVYKFLLNSDDGSRLTIGGMEIINNDGSRGAAVEKAGSIQLSPGLHPLNVLYYRWSLGETLQLRYSVNGGVTQAVGAAMVRRTPTTNGLYYLINAGTLGGYGRRYQADAFFTGGTFMNRPGAVSNTSDDVVFGNLRKGAFTYNLPVTSGTYKVRLGFMEPLRPHDWQRRINVSAEGVSVLTNFSIVANAGMYNAWFTNALVTVADGQLTLAFTHSTTDEAILAMLAVEHPDYDTDNDGLPDAWEVANGFNTNSPADRHQDTDGDGLIDYLEWVWNANPTVSDTDGDGLSDNNEVHTRGTLPDRADTDNDGMPDKWEINNGTNPLRWDRNSDVDGDGLVNYEEYLRGTRANGLDTDGDGISDGDEVRAFTDPTATNFVGVASTVHSVPGSALQADLAHWVTNNGYIFSRNNGGLVSTVIDVPTSGWYLLTVEGSQFDPMVGETTFELRLNWDGIELGSRWLTANFVPWRTVSWILPFAEAGEHPISIRWVYRGEQGALRITSVRLDAPVGLDANSNGTPDWVEYRQSQRHLNLPPSESSVSPICVEGSGTLYQTVTVVTDYTPPGGPSSVTVNPAPRRGWYADAQLSPTNPTSLQIGWEDGTSWTGEVHWVPLNLMHTGAPSTLLMRRGDSLMFSALPAGYSGGTALVQIVSVTNHVLVDAASATHRFDSDGVFAITAVWSDGATTVTSTPVAVDVFGGSFADTPLLWPPDSRMWDNPQLPSRAVIQSDPELGVKLFTLPDGARSFSLMLPRVMPARTMIARLHEGGPILDHASVESAYFYAGGQLTVSTVQTYPDGSSKMELSLSGLFLVDGISVKIQFKTAGLVFLDGTTSKTLTAADFDEAGYVTLQYIKSPTASLCHEVTVYQDDIVIGVQ